MHSSSFPSNRPSARALTTTEAESVIREADSSLFNPYAAGGSGGGFPAHTLVMLHSWFWLLLLLLGMLLLPPLSWSDLWLFRLPLLQPLQLTPLSLFLPIYDAIKLLLACPSERGIFSRSTMPSTRSSHNQRLMCSQPQHRNACDELSERVSAIVDADRWRGNLLVLEMLHVAVAIAFRFLCHSWSPQSQCDPTF